MRNFSDEIGEEDQRRLALQDAEAIAEQKKAGKDYVDPDVACQLPRRNVTGWSDLGGRLARAMGTKVLKKSHLAADADSSGWRWVAPVQGAHTGYWTWTTTPDPEHSADDFMAVLEWAWGQGYGDASLFQEWDRSGSTFVDFRRAVADNILKVAEAQDE